MKTFKENLKKFCEEMNESEAGVAQLADLNNDEMIRLKSEVGPHLTLYKFCINAGISLESIYSDSGFETIPLEKQYANYPTPLKKVVSRLFCRQLIRSFCENSETIFKVQLKLTKIGSQILSKVISGNGCFSPADFEEIYAGMSSLTTESSCKCVLAKCMYSLIPNYNLTQLKEHFSLSYKQISEILNISASAVSNWGSIGAVPVPELYYKKLAFCLGGFSEQEFTTTILSAPDYANRKCNLTLPLTESVEPSIEPESAMDPSNTELNFIDPPTDEILEVAEPVKTPVKKKKVKRSKAKPAKRVKTKSRQAAPLAEPMQRVEPASELKAATDSILTEDRLVKMYNNLNSDNKARIDSMIVELFFAQL